MVQAHSVLYYCQLLWLC